MPLYEYHCHQCGSFEIILDSNKIANSYICPTCCEQANRIFSPPTFCSVFSGTRHALRKRADQSYEPRIMGETEKKHVFGTVMGLATINIIPIRDEKQTDSRPALDDETLMEHASLKAIVALIFVLIGLTN